MGYKLHLTDDTYDRLAAYSRGRDDTYRTETAVNPYKGNEELCEAWENGRGDELESFA